MSHLICAIEEYLRRYRKIPEGKSIKQIKFGPFPNHGAEWLLMWSNEIIPMEITFENGEVLILEFNGKS